MAQIPFPITTYQLADGTPLANGYLLVRLSQEGSTADSQLSNRSVTVPLDGSGQIITNSFYPNNTIFPSGTYYIISAFTATGQLVCKGLNKTLLL